MEEQLHVFEVRNMHKIIELRGCHLKVSFDHEKARRDGIIIPHKGVNLSYDNALAQIGNISKQLDDYLQQQRKRLNCKVSSHAYQVHIISLFLHTEYCLLGHW